jgi:hypothetical protein
VACAWTAATAAATFLGWLAVGSVLLPTQAPLTVVPVEAVSTGQAGDPTIPSPASSAPADPSDSAPPSSASSQTPSSGSPSAAPTSASPSDTSSADANIQRYPTAGGIVVLDVEAHDVTLVSAVPASGYMMADWVETGWLRVDFTGSTTVYTVLATWNGSSPQVQVFQDPVD